MTAITEFKNAGLNVEINVINVGDEPWFKGKDVASSLDYFDTNQAIQKHVDEEDKYTLETLASKHGGVKTTPLNHNEKQTIYINEAGLYSLILRSKKPEAKLFKRWVCSEVLPSIRKTGKYKAPFKPKQKEPVVAQQLSILNECDLHNKVIYFIRKKFEHAIIIPGLGELQTTTWARSKAYKAGYKGGQPDLLILNYHTEYNGFAIELKTPTVRG